MFLWCILGGAAVALLIVVIIIAKIPTKEDNDEFVSRKDFYNTMYRCQINRETNWDKDWNKGDWM